MRNKQPGSHGAPGAIYLNNWGLYGRDVFGLGSLFTSDNLHRYLLAFVQGLAAFALDCAEMNEYILSAFLLNKSKPF